MLFPATLEGNEISWHLTLTLTASCAGHPKRIRNVGLFMEWPLAIGRSPGTGIYQGNYPT